MRSGGFDAETRRRRDAEENAENTKAKLLPRTLRDLPAETGELDADPAKALCKEFGLPTEPDSDKAFEAKMDAGHDQHALVHADALAQFVAGSRRVVTHQAE